MNRIPIEGKLKFQEYKEKHLKKIEEMKEKIEEEMKEEIEEEIEKNLKKISIEKKNEKKNEETIKLDFNIIINATEYLTFNKNKFSKSKKIGIFGLDLVNKSIGDVTKWKFYLLRRRPEIKDADFSISEFIEIISNELIGNLGNFINRTLKFLDKNINKSK